MRLLASREENVKRVQYAKHDAVLCHELNILSSKNL